MNITKRFLFSLARNTFNTNINAKTRPSMAKFYSVNDPDSIVAAVQLLESGGVIAVPTDTLYGLACDATNPSAIDRLYKIKCRDENKPVAICVGRIRDIHKWGNTDNIPPTLFETLLPGPVTLILPCCGSLDKSLTYKKKVGIRIPDYHFIRDIASYLNKPLALTSANRSNGLSSLTIEDFSELWEKVSAVFDGGKVNITREGSTIIDLSSPGFYKILRSGIAEDKTISNLKKVGLKEGTLQYE